MLQEVPQSGTDRHPRILVVDDDAWLLDAITESLVTDGDEVVACGSYDAAKRLLLEGPFDALLTDVRLRGSNGLQLAVIASQLYPSMPVIVFSGFDDPVLRAEAEKLNAIYLVKPVSASTLRGLLRPPTL